MLGDRLVEVVELLVLVLIAGLEERLVADRQDVHPVHRGGQHLVHPGQFLVHRRGAGLRDFLFVVLELQRQQRSVAPVGGLEKLADLGLLRRIVLVGVAHRVEAAQPAGFDFLEFGEGDDLRVAVEVRAEHAVRSGRAGGTGLGGVPLCGRGTTAGDPERSRSAHGPEQPAQPASRDGFRLARPRRVFRTVLLHGFLRALSAVRTPSPEASHPSTGDPAVRHFCRPVQVIPFARWFSAAAARAIGARLCAASIPDGDLRKRVVIRRGRRLPATRR